MADNKTASLTVLGGPLAGTQSELPESGTLTIGSSPDSSLYLDLPAVSPYHARIVIGAGRITAHDTGSSRTVHVNDNAIGPEGTELRNGDILWLGAPGDDDVVMMQCILPRTGAAPTPPGTGSTGATPTPDIETVALWATEAPSQGMAEALADAAHSELPPLASDELAQALAEAASEPSADAPELVSPAAAPEPVTFPEETPAEAEAGGVAAAFVDEEFAEVAPTLLMSSPDEVADAVDPGYRETVSLDAPPEFTHEVFDAPTAAPILDATPEVEPPPPAPPAPKPAPAPPRPAPSRAAAWQTTRPHPPSTSQRLGTSASQRQRARPIPARAPEPSAEIGDEPLEQAAGSRRPLLLAVGGFVAVVAVAGGGFLAWRTFGSPAAEPGATPAPVALTSDSAPPPIAATPEPEAPAPTPEPIEAAVPSATPQPEPVGTQPAPVATPTPRPTPTPRATPSPAAGLATPTPGPAGPSPEQLRAQQAADQAQALVGQAEAALAARQYDAALAHVDGALRLEPGNARATSLRRDVAQRRDLARRRFVAGRTAVDSEKTRKEKQRGGLVGFDTDARTPDFLGRIEFEMSPASGIEANDAWTLRVFVVNQGAKPIRVTSLAVGTTVNGAGSGGPVTPAAREIAPQQRVLLGESTGTWRDGTTEWVAEATLTAPRNETLRNTLSWK